MSNRVEYLILVGGVALAALACSTEVRVSGGDPPIGEGGAGGTGPTSTTGVTTGVGAGPGARPPEPPLDGMPTGPGAQLVVRRLWVGDTSPGGTPSPQAWKSFGYDIDGQPGDLGPHCQPLAGANPAKVFQDGDAGRDNNFGHVILEVLTGLEANYGAKINELLEQGAGDNLLFDLLAVGDGDHLGSLGYVYRGAPLSSAPAFDGGDAWSVTSESLNSPPNLDDPSFRFNGYVSQSVWVSQAGPLDLSLPAGVFPLDLPLSTALITIEVGGTRGVLSGVIDLERFIDRFEQVAGAFDPNLCSGATLEAIKDEFRKAADIMLDGTQDPNQPCNGISVGMDFEVAPVQIAGVAPPVPATPDPCP